MDYKKSLNLPQTEFPMRARLPELEPRILAQWESQDLYGKIQQLNRDNSKHFILHDGPPYANGHVHLGTALNKILKDFIVKSRTMMGFFAPYVPGWDCHGMPIEHNVIKELGGKAADLSKTEIRKHCREFAQHYLTVQREEFMRLGCIGDWFRPYITMSNAYEAETVAALGELVSGNYVYRGLRPIHWCATCMTALAEAELEYHEHTSPSIYVKFPVRKGDEKLKNLGKALSGASVLIWTTTPWTIPANLAIALHPQFHYVFAKSEGEVVLVAEELLEATARALAWKDVRTVARVRGEELLGMRCRHPMYDRDSVIILANYVTLDAGTGCVHTAPGHGAEDFESGKEYGLPIFSPVDDRGCFTSEVAGYQGMNVFDANRPITDQLEREGYLLAREELTHSYPFCWRCKQPLIFRATEQWFLNVDANDLRKRALREIEKVSWVPPWGQQRISNMVQTRPDWCLSRQRSWGVPIPALYCKGCGKANLSPGVIEKVRRRVAEGGSDVWYQDPVETFLPEGFCCAWCQGTSFEKEEDILDVWFDSSVSQRAVLEHHPDLVWPCDLYLEASDQHRGWFQVSLLTAVGTRGAAPYRQVLTHGLILDEGAKKMSKSMGNVIVPQEVIDQYGGDILRLLFASVDYTSDICFSRGMLEPMTDAYRKIRNTLRFMVGNIKDFNPTDHSVEEAGMQEVDRWVLSKMREVARRAWEAYLVYHFHVIYHALLDLCIVDLSAFYLDIIKDRLYVTTPADPTRRSAQTALYQITVDLLAMLAPILSFTAEEAWGYLPAKDSRPESVHLARLPEGGPVPGDGKLLGRWARLRKLRAEMNKALDSSCKAGTVRSGLDARLVIQATPDTRKFIESFGEQLAEVLKVAAVEFVDGLKNATLVSSEEGGFAIEVRPAAEEKCARCWNRRPEVGSDPKRPDLCARCIEVLNKMGI